MSWFKRIRQGITTTTREKKETPEGLWYKCPQCKHIATAADNEANLWVCVKFGYHQRITSEEYFSVLFDDGEYSELFAKLKSSDPLDFVDTQPYKDRVEISMRKTKLRDALAVAIGDIEGVSVLIACMDFNFIGGSMGSVVGEKIARSIDYCIEHKLPLVIISKSGGARMMEAAYSLMQMAKTSAKLTQLSAAKLPYISFLTDPTTGGVTASFAMLGDINISEPGALIGFAGPRVVKETIGKELPTGFQTAEFVLEHGFLDKIVERKDLRHFIANMVKFFAN